MNPSSSYIPQMYLPFDGTRKQNQRSTCFEPERQSVLRDGSRGSAENAGANKRLRYALANCEMNCQMDLLWKFKSLLVSV